MYFSIDDNLGFLKADEIEESNKSKVFYSLFIHEHLKKVWCLTIGKMLVLYIFYFYQACEAMLYIVVVVVDTNIEVFYL